MSVLHGSTNTTINDGVFNAVSNTVSNTVVNSVPARSDAVSVLLLHSATAGLLDAAERFDAPKCDEGTRMSMLRGMRSFVQQGGRPAVYWLHGPAGIGKSALGQSLALALKEEGDHAASFFFSRTAPGRNDGGQLIVTLACQLALNIPLLKPILAKALKNNPLVFNATNAIKMQTLIVNPINQLHKKFRWSPRSWAQRLAKRQLHPRLILVDGLDECHDPQVQRDLILCIGRAVRQIALPFRFVIASRPESHILATFELDPIFQGPDGVHLVTKNLGDDEDADEQITTFLLKEFAEIRRTHPIKDFLPQQWPLPGQVAQLVSKSSKGFIYPATVIRYIKMPKNRPDECLERILGLSEIPESDKPYEPIDVLYRYIFDSVPDEHKQAVRNIFHFLVVPHNLNFDITTPRFIERYFDYKPGHVQHVLRDLLCIVSVAGLDQPITVLHASLPDFLLDFSRSRPLCIKSADAHAMIIMALYDKLSGLTIFTTSSEFTQIIYHLMNAKMTEELADVLLRFDPLYEYKRFCNVMEDSRGAGASRDMSISDSVPLRESLPSFIFDSSELTTPNPESFPKFTIPNPKSFPNFTIVDSKSFLEFTTLTVAYLLILETSGAPATCIHSHIEGIEAYILHTYPLGAALHAVQDSTITAVFPTLRKCAVTRHTHISDIYDSQSGYGMRHPSGLVERIAKLHILMMSPFYALYLPTPDGNAADGDFYADAMNPHLRYPRLAHIFLIFLASGPSGAGIDGLLQLAVELISRFLALSGYSAPLYSHLKDILATSESDLESNPNAEYIRKLIPNIELYHERVRGSSSESMLNEIH